MTTSTSRRSSSDPTGPRAASVRDELTFRRAAGPTVHIRCSVRAHGDFHRIEVPLPELERRRRALVDLPWTMLTEQHGVGVVHVGAPGDGDGAIGDVAVTAAVGAALGCWVGDCAPVVLVGRDRRLGVVHAGWRGLAAGVIDIAFDAFDEPVELAVLGPCIGPCCYQFGEHDLSAVAAGVGAARSAVAATMRDGGTALDVPAAVERACARRGVAVRRLGDCTGCRYDGFSHRVRRERGRHVVVAWQGDET